MVVDNYFRNLPVLRLPVTQLLHLHHIYTYWGLRNQRNVADDGQVFRLGLLGLVQEAQLAQQLATLGQGDSSILSDYRYRQKTVTIIDCRAFNRRQFFLQKFEVSYSQTSCEMADGFASPPDITRGRCMDIRYHGCVDYVAYSVSISTRGNASPGDVAESGLQHCQGSH